MIRKLFLISGTPTGIAVLIIGCVLSMCEAGPLIGAEDADIALRREAPVYTGPFEVGDLEPLNLEDFEAFGTEPESPRDQYLEYQKMLEGGADVTLIPYRLRIVDRDLALSDFYGFNVPESLSQARYNGYLSMVPSTVNGNTVHYVFVYHRPLGLKGSGQDDRLL